MAEKRRELGVDQKELILGLIREGFSQRSIAKYIGKSNSTVSRVITKYKESGSLENKKRSGRPSKISDRDNRKLSRIVTSDRGQTLADITSAFNEGRQQASKCAKITIRKHLYKLGYKCQTVQVA